jgi:hypothetical protein
MARIHEEIITIKISKLVRNEESCGKLADLEIVQSLEAVVQELVGSDVIVEIAETN